MKHLRKHKSILKSTICPRSRDPFYIVTYYIKWVTTSWTISTILKIWILFYICVLVWFLICVEKIIIILRQGSLHAVRRSVRLLEPLDPKSRKAMVCTVHTMCPRSSYPFYIVTYYIKWVTTSWTYRNAWEKGCRKKYVKWKLAKVLCVYAWSFLSNAEYTREKFSNRSFI